MTKKYFHELSDSEWEDLQKTKMTWDDLNKFYKQPDWCNYPDALNPLGCWGLIYRHCRSEQYCSKCDLHDSIMKPEEVTNDKV